MSTYNKDIIIIIIIIIVIVGGELKLWYNSYYTVYAQSYYFTQFTHDALL